MSFVERHKVWLLPLLGLGVIGVVYLNMRMLGGSPAPAATSESAAADPKPQGMAPMPAVVLPPPPEAAPIAQPSGTQDLWADLRALETPPSSLTATAELLSKGERPRDLSTARRMPGFHPDQWERVGRMKPLPAVPDRESPSMAEPEKVPPPLPVVTFVGRTPEGPIAWIQQRPCREGDLLPDGYRIVRIALDRVRFEWAGRSFERPVLPLSAPPKEAP